MEQRDDRAALVDSLQRAIDAVPREGLPGDGTAPASTSAPRDDDDRSELSAAANRAYAILAQRDHSRAELRTKLIARDHPEPVVDDLLDRLADARLLDDQRFAESFVRSQRQGRGSSQGAIRRSLRQKGVADEDAADALADAGDDLPFALEAARKKARSTRSLAPEVRLRRILGVLGRRGFGGSIAQRAARQALEEEPGTHAP
ncbi:regulatory protein RecX [Brevibacterium senegalense]|uniref:regulatory protein RecX n=1 Tax=Brevibacterium senegalense TaxID=1033736 RepID=UPI0002DFBB33|nr:regulatory protein RecX [Brevibacterium senegalense]